MAIVFDDRAAENDKIRSEVGDFLSVVKTLESTKKSPIIVYQDGKSKGYYIKCSILAETACPLLDTNARLDPISTESFRANRDLLTEHNTYKRMVADAREGREFNDIIVEYTKDYCPERPMKIWGGQHRAKAIQKSYTEGRVSRYHGFRVFFNLSKQQRTEIALISNTNIAVSNDLFDRLQEETLIGLNLRKWCYQVGTLKEGEDFPDQGSRSERMTVKLARTFVTNFFMGKERARKLKGGDLDNNIYEPYLCESGANLDEEYEKLIGNLGEAIWQDQALLRAGRAYASLHRTQFSVVKEGKGRIQNLKGFRNKAMTESVISAWAYVGGLLQIDGARLENHYSVPRTSKAIPDPLNAKEMSTFSHDTDDLTYRGLGTRSAIKDRQRMAQVFLARSIEKGKPIDKALMNKAVSQVVGIKSLRKGYTV